MKYLHDSHINRRHFLKGVAATGALLAAGRLPVYAADLQKPPDNDLSWESVTGRHPAGAALRRLFPDKRAPQGVTSGLTRADYLPLMAGIVDFFHAHQNAAGAIIDPYAHREIQYATPAFAAAAALLVKEAGRSDLLEPAARALTFAIQALVNHTTADGHADFYIPLVIHARRFLIGHASAPQDQEWTRLLSSLVPEKTYSDTTARLNWNIVNVAGECLRRQDGLVPPEQRDAQMAYIERSLVSQERAMTPYGMFHDPNAPLAYDIFPRLWLEGMFAPGVYQGQHRARWQEFLTLGGLSTLLLQSPNGEWACGGRSADHQWNEAAVAVVCEANAVRWKALDRPDVAGAFKRGAHLALASLLRWKRPSGELWIVKNRAAPSLRHGYETYSYHSQYNLLPAAMLAIAYASADETIPETPLPAETGAYVFDLRETFHKICASAGGAYALLETGADPHYNATGLMRVHKAGVNLSAFSDNTAADRAYGPPDVKVNEAMSPGLAWETTPSPGAASEWVSLADFTGADFAEKERPRVVDAVELAGVKEEPTQVQFTLNYHLTGSGARSLSEDYVVSAEGVQVTSRLTDAVAPGSVRVLFPVLVSDGAQDTQVSINGAAVSDPLTHALTVWEVLTPQRLTMKFTGPRVPSHNGWVQAVVADLPTGTTTVYWRLRLTSSGGGA